MSGASPPAIMVVTLSPEPERGMETYSTWMPRGAICSLIHSDILLFSMVPPAGASPRSHSMHLMVVVSSAIAGTMPIIITAASSRTATIFLRLFMGYSSFKFMNKPLRANSRGNIAFGIFNCGNAIFNALSNSQPKNPPTILERRRFFALESMVRKTVALFQAL